jgi:hypothetical protein
MVEHVAQISCGPRFLGFGALRFSCIKTEAPTTAA